jgi:peptidoglycan biosynthesis protein MviN/MurJ (putative lipid II flippase)
MIFAKGAPQIAIIFGFLCIAIFFRVIYTIFSRYFYAQKDTWTPLFVSLFAIALNIYLAWNLSQPDKYGVAGLALAQSIVAAAEVVVLFCVMVWRDHHLFDKYFWSSIWRIISITGFSVVATYIMVQFIPLHINDRGLITLSVKFGLIAAVTMSVHLGLSYLFDLEEAKPVIERLKQLRRLILKPVKVDF